MDILTAPVFDYDLTQGSLIIGGLPIKGFSEGDAIDIKRNKKDVELTIGADGEGVFSTQNDRSGMITINLMQTATAAKQLTALAQPSNRFDFIYESPDGYTFKASDCRFESNLPDRKYATKVGAVAFVLIAPYLDVLPVGINTPVTLPSI